MRFALRIHPSTLTSDGAGVERVAEELFALFSSTDFDALAASLTALEPQHPEYRKMMAELARYRQLAAENEDIQLPKAAKKLKLGSEGEVVQLLEKRLIMEGYLEGDVTGTYDERLQKAVSAYQETHQFKPDGLMDRKARSSMNIPMSRRAEQLARGLQRHREVSFTKESGASESFPSRRASTSLSLRRPSSKRQVGARTSYGGWFKCHQR